MQETGLATQVLGAVLKRRLAHTLRYWMETEVHVYGFSIAANVLLSFFPFLIVMISVCHKLLGWKTAGDAINLAIRDYFPDQLGVFISSGLPHKTLQFASVFLLLFTANGVFEPLEVALNRAWGIAKNRSFVRNQMVSLCLIFACGTLALVSSLLTGIGMRQLGGDPFSGFITMVFFKTAAVPMSILMLFLIYWLLPNAKISPRFVLPPAIFVGLALEASEIHQSAHLAPLAEEAARRIRPLLLFGQHRAVELPGGHGDPGRRRMGRAGRRRASRSLGRGGRLVPALKGNRGAAHRRE